VLCSTAALVIRGGFLVFLVPLDVRGFCLVLARGWHAALTAAGADRLISIGDIRTLFKLGRTAAYELTRRPGFPAPVQVSRRCLRWWASEVDAYADALQREGAPRGTRRAATRDTGERTAVPRRTTGTVRTARGRRTDRRSHGSGLNGLYDGGHGADQLPESLDWPGFAGDVDAGV
jgi:predicted DNA-binding transcriptional regulator AlpA